MAKLQTSPGNALSPSRLCPPHLQPSFPYRYRILNVDAFSSSLTASYAISVRRASALPAASFRFHLAMDTLAVRLTIPPVGLVGDFHSQVRAPCRAHVKPRAATEGRPYNKPYGVALGEGFSAGGLVAEGTGGGAVSGTTLLVGSGNAGAFRLLFALLLLLLFSFAFT